MNLCVVSCEEFLCERNLKKNTINIVKPELFKNILRKRKIEFLSASKELKCPQNTTKSEVFLNWLTDFHELNL